MIAINPHTIHEADVAIWNAWHDGTPLGGPSSRHLQSAAAAAFRSEITIRQIPDAEGSPSFGDWRESPAMGRRWAVDLGYPLGSLSDVDAPVSCFVPPGMPVIIVVRFRDTDTGDWRVMQFHHAEVGQTEAKDQGEWMMTTYPFTAGHMEEFRGKGAGMPGMFPRLRGVIEWCHAGRTIPCHHFDSDTNSWQETDENEFPAGEGTARYVDLVDTGGDWSLSYMAAHTQFQAEGGAGITISRISYMDAIAFTVSESSGLTFAPGWQFQTGAAEIIAQPPSAAHWEHPRVVFRFLGRIYATLAHGLLATPSHTPTPPPVPPLDFPIRIGRLLLLPHGSHILPATP